MTAQTPPSPDGAGAPGPDAGEAWAAFCDGLKQAGQEIMQATADPHAQAEGVLQLAQLTEGSLRWHLLGGSAELPRFVQINDTCEVADNLFAPLRPDLTYRLRGNIAHLFDLNVSVHAGWGFVPGADRRIWGDLGRKDLEVDADGNFELLLGPAVPEGRGLRLEEGAAYLQIREYFADWAKDRPGRFAFERLGSAGEALPHPAPAELARALPPALEWVSGYHHSHQRIIRTNFAAEPNSVVAPERRAGGNRNIQYGFGRFALREGEGLLVSFPAPRARLWNIQWLNRWYEMTDQANRLTGLVSTQAHVDEDGMVRIVLARSDPGSANWLDCSGHDEGIFLVRWFWGEDSPPIACTLLPLEKLRAALPASHPHATPSDRAALQALRRAHFAERRR